MALLHAQEIDGLLDGTAWRKDGTVIVRDVAFAGFTEAVAFVNRVAVDAEQADHHPDILIHGYRKVQIRLSTHSEGGITMRDVDLARAIDARL